MLKTEDFYKINILGNIYISKHIELFKKWFDTDTDREHIASQLNVQIVKLLSIYNNTAPISHENYYDWKNNQFFYTIMYGLVDDYFGERYGKFGRPITFRVYLKTDNKLSDEIFKLADWNFMSAGKECFIGYIIGSIYDNKLWISGIQSDISQRYSWLFQKRGIREIRVGNQVKKMDNSQFIQEYKKEIPIIRNTFQRDWIKILLCSILHFITNNGINTFLLQKFELDELENKKGAFMHRIYRELPQKLNASLTTINVDNIELTYSSIKKNDLAQYLTKFSSEK